MSGVGRKPAIPRLWRSVTGRLAWLVGAILSVRVRRSRRPVARPSKYEVRRRGLLAQRRRRRRLGPAVVLLGIGMVMVALAAQLHAAADGMATTGLRPASARAAGESGLEQAAAVSGRTAMGTAVPLPVSPADVEKQAEQILDAAGGTSAMVALVPGKPPLVSVNPTQVVAAASLYKLGVMAAVFQAAADGEVRLDQQITITQEDVDLYGDAPATPAGTVLSVQEALGRVITVSDNSAAGALIDLVSPDKVDAAFGANGMPRSHLGSGPGIEPRTIAQTTAADQVAFYQRLLAGQVVSGAASEDMLALLEAQQENDRLPAKLPAGTLMAHKTGELDGVRNDSGIIFTPYGPVICAVLVSDQPAAGRAVEAIADAGLLVYRSFVDGRPPPP
ncbi:MAG: serine hydrolase [Chloroflexota bacterium]|nr:serine hydrolase [Chloroflexota bacterium]